ncbi:MAG: TRAP transporter small permease subunit [Candidatus Eutrophobiaceae bacterium]
MLVEQAAESFSRGAAFRPAKELIEQVRNENLHCFIAVGWGMRRLSSLIQIMNEWFGRCVSWLLLVLVLIVAYDVLMRYAFSAGSIALQELAWHVFSAIILLSIAYTSMHDGHVRLDVFYQSGFMNDRRRAWVDLFGDLFFLLPFCALVVYCSLPFVEQAWIHGESSPDSGGLGQRWLPKAFIPLGFALAFLQGFARVITLLDYLINSSRQSKENDDRAAHLL